MNTRPLFLAFFVLALAGLSACQYSAVDNPWDKPVASRPAGDNPQTLVKNNVAKTYEAGPAPDVSVAGPKMLPRIVKIGLLVPQTGQHAQLGEAMLKAAQLALFDTGVQGFELVIRDTQGTPAGARQAFREVLEDDVELVLGPVFASSVQAVKDVQRRGLRRPVPVISFTNDWTVAGQDTYVMGFLPYVQAQRVMEYAIKQGYVNIGALIPQGPYGDVVLSAFQNKAAENPEVRTDFVRLPADSVAAGNVIRLFSRYDTRANGVNERIELMRARLQRNPNDREAVAELQTLRQQERLAIHAYDAVLMPLGASQAVEAANLLTYYDLGPKKVKRLGTGLWDDAQLARDPNLKGGWYAAPSPNGWLAFSRRYRETYAVDAPRIATLAYDATAMAITLTQAGLSEGASPRFAREDLTNANGFYGIDGIFRFEESGLIERGLAVLEFRQGGRVEIDPAPRTFYKKQDFPLHPQPAPEKPLP